MRNNGRNKSGGDSVASLTTLMQAVVDARSRMERARGRLRNVEEKIEGPDQSRYERKRDQALSEYKEAVGKMRRARMELLKQLKERAA